MAESSFQSTALKFLNGIPQCCAENVSGNSQQSGRADINGVYHGMSFRIELKVLDEGNKPTLKQMINLMKWFKSGSAICVAYTMGDIEHFIMNFRTKTPWNTGYPKNCCSFGYYKEDAHANSFFKEYRKLHIQN